MITIISALNIYLYTINISISFFFLFFYNATATTDIYTLSLHDALPILLRKADRELYGMKSRSKEEPCPPTARGLHRLAQSTKRDRKSTRLNSSHQIISYAVFCLKKKKKKKKKNK